MPRKSTLSQNVSTLQKQATTRSFPTPFPTTTSTTNEPTNASPTPPASKPSTYNQSYLAALKASTPTRATLQREPGAVIAYDEDGDTSMPLDDEQGVEDTTAGIPDEAAIKSAIARRRRHAAHGVNPPTAAAAGTGDDYISLTADTSRLAVYDHSTSTTSGPHPESRLQRESDSEGEGDEQFAAFTGADERLGLRAGAGGGGGGNQEHARRMRREMRDALEDVDMDDGLVGGAAQGGEEVEDEERWEDEQVRRAGAGSAHRLRTPNEPVRDLPSHS